ncbi:hypothetical protein NDU88_005898 [Pleurodeles waltl]|uniref:Uncharacterized protein n=1 Tax=Pleurodeles waltl TaxID=8319 RepID=A0AAV7MY17_PLEWA|nr:hypothetical protein NDU88_005898 [Pleurodeles waltl]
MVGCTFGVQKLGIAHVTTYWCREMQAYTLGAARQFAPLTLRDIRREPPWQSKKSRAAGVGSLDTEVQRGDDCTSIGASEYWGHPVNPDRW